MATHQAIWNHTVIAESNHTIVVEGNHYFPLDSVRDEYLQPSGSRSVCYWKGTASYYDVVVDGARNKDAAWYYPDPSPAARRIGGYVAFWHGVKVRRVPGASPAEPTTSRSVWLRRLIPSAQHNGTENPR
jgi:uncharacterized protein (DUF427 family)